ncbi:hypothetical protein [Natronococcus sp.]|uniref:hypothetical protein n=1 Tax=Natronococcus sp. TaxID=35747 RepID=UPI0025CC474A|nr:hypothetical protein [Natronococcus sp.]
MERAISFEHVEHVVDGVQHVIRVLPIAFELLVASFDFVRSRSRLPVVDTHGEACNAGECGQDRWRSRGNAFSGLEVVDNDDASHDAESGETPASNTWIKVGIDIGACEPIRTVYEKGTRYGYHQSDGENIYRWLALPTHENRPADSIYDE